VSLACLVIGSACGGSDGTPARSAAKDNTHQTHATVPTTTTVAPTLPPTTAAEPAPPPPPPPPPVATEPPLPTAGSNEIVRGNPGRAAIALTFDCGSGAGPTPSIIDTLRAHGLRVTFFLTGKWVEQNPDLARTIAASHDLANHSYSHGDFAEMSDAQIADEMERTEAIITEVTGRATKPVWRAPFGSRNQHILGVVAGLGWPMHIFWTVDALDWQQISPQEVLGRVLNGASNGGIVLQHCGSPQTAEVLDQEINELQARGFTITTVADVIG